MSSQDRLLNLRLVPHMIYEMQSTFYPLVANEYGVPLDSRHTVCPQPLFLLH